MIARSGVCLAEPSKINNHKPLFGICSQLELELPLTLLYRSAYRDSKIMPTISIHVDAMQVQNFCYVYINQIT